MPSSQNTAPSSGWRAAARVLPASPARHDDVDEPHWKPAADIPGLYQVEPPPVQTNVEANASPAPTVSHAGASGIAADTATTTSKPPSRNILVETFRIYFRGFFQFFGLSLLSIVPIVCAELSSRFVDTAPGVNVDLRTLVGVAVGLCMLVLRIVLVPVYIAGIQILTAELATGHRLGF